MNELTNRICILSDMRVIVVWESVAGLYKIFSDGIEEPEPLHTEPSFTKDSRMYVCINCGWQTEGNTADAFDIVRKHIGHKNEFLHPFGGNIGSLNTYPTT